MKRRGIWVERPIEECWRKTGKGPISVRWVDTDKGIDGSVDVRSRLVARDFKGKGGGKEKEDSIYASTPPLKGLWMLCSKAASVGRNGASKKVLAHVRSTSPAERAARTLFTFSVTTGLQLSALLHGQP